MERDGPTYLSVSEEDEEVPETAKVWSEGWVAGWCLACIGCASLFSWNAVITASSYYQKRLCGTPLHRSFESVFSVTYQVTSLAGNLYAARVAEEMSAASRIVPRLKALAILFAGFAALACVNLSNWIFVPATLTGMALCGLWSQTLCAALYGVAAAMPPPFVSWNMAGQAVGGLIPALLVVATDLAYTPDEAGCGKGVDVSAVGYFAAASLLFVLATVAFGTLRHTRVYRDHVAVPEDALLGGDAEQPADLKDIFGVAKAIAVPAAAVFSIFAVTLATFPTLTSLARPYGHADDDDGSGSTFRRLYVPLLFLLFNVGDFAGRASAPLFSSLLNKPRALLALAIARVGFVPVIALGTLKGGRNNGPAVFKESLAPFVVMLPYAVSNGLIATLGMAAGPKLLPPKRRELAGNILANFLTLGLATGSALSFGLLALV